MSWNSTGMPQTQSNSRPTGTWAFLTNHAHVLLCIARDPQSRARDIAEHVGITERAAQRILADLLAEGYISRSKVGRRNHYAINASSQLRHPVIRDVTIGPLLSVLAPAERRPGRSTGARTRAAAPTPGGCRPN